MKPYFKDDFAALVPEEHRWVSRWVAAAERLGVPLVRTSLADGALRMEMAGDGAPWTAVLRPGGGGPGWRTVCGYVLVYEGLADLDEGTGSVLERLALLLNKFAAHLPERFEGFAFAGRRDADPAAALRSVFPFATVERSSQDHGDVT